MKKYFRIIIGFVFLLVIIASILFKSPEKKVKEYRQVEGKTFELSSIVK